MSHDLNHNHFETNWCPFKRRNGHWHTVLNPRYLWNSPNTVVLCFSSLLQSRLSPGLQRRSIHHLYHLQYARHTCQHGSLKDQVWKLFIYCTILYWINVSAGAALNDVWPTLWTGSVCFTHVDATFAWHLPLDSWMGWICQSRRAGLQLLRSPQCPRNYFQQSGTEEFTS